MIKLTPADLAFSNLIRERAKWRCQRCGAHHPKPSKSLHCSHYEGRGNWATRFDPDNCIALCHGCHSFLDGRRIEFREFYISINGENKLREIERKALDHAGLAKLFRRTKGIGDIAAHFRNQFDDVVGGADIIPYPLD